MRLKILSYNIHKGWNITNKKLIIHQVRDIIRQTTADIIFLQEVQGQNHIGTKKHQDYPLNSQFEFLADQHWPHYSYGQNASYQNGHHGNAILSRFPILVEHNLNLTLHPLECRGLQHLKILIPEIQKEMHLFNTHLNLMHSHRMKQWRLIQDYLGKLSMDDSMIFCGDFNDWHVKLHPIIASSLGLDEIHQILHHELGKSFPSIYPLVPLDRIYFKNLRPHHAEVLNFYPWKELSDHLPIYGEFEL